MNSPEQIGNDASVGHSRRPDVVLALNDLIFETKVRSTAESLGRSVSIIRTADEACWAGINTASMVIIDLNSLGPACVSRIRELRRSSSRVQIVAFVSHVNRELAEAARKAGASEVMPRSRFAAQLARMLAPDNQ